MEDLMTYKAKSIGYADVGVDNPTFNMLEGVIYGLTISQDAPGETPIEGEFVDMPLKTINTMSQYTIEFDLGIYNPKHIQDLEGGTYNPTTGVYEMPTSAVEINKQWQLSFYHGIDYIHVHYGKTSVNWSGGDLKTTPYMLHVRIVALVKNGKSVSKKFLPEGVSLGSVKMSDITGNGAKATYSVSLSAGSTITEKGVCYAQHKNPLTTDTKSVSTGTSAGESTSTLTGLTASTAYYLRPYVVYEGNVVYGDEVSFNTTTA